MEHNNATEIHEKLGAEMPYKWRVQSFSKKKPLAICVAYIDSRDVQRRLDEVVGCWNWQVYYKEIKGRLYAGIAIRNNDEWVWKWDCGTESKEDPEKGEASDSFKRAAVKWNIGRFLYNLPIQYVTANEVKTSNNYPYCVDGNGKKIHDLTKFINDSNGKFQQEPSEDNKVNSERKRIKEGTTNWTKAVKHLSEGGAIEDIEEHLIVTDFQKKKLVQEAELKAKAA